MLYPLKVTDIEISDPIQTITGLDKYMGLKGLVRLHGNPVGYIDVPVISGQVSKNSLAEAIIDKYHSGIFEHLAKNLLASSKKLKTPQLQDLFDVAPPQYQGGMPLVTVTVCTRNRTADLALCLASLDKIDYPNLDLLVIDNAPDNNDTERLIKSDFPHIRYILESRPGLDWARNRAIAEAKGEIIAATDADTVVSSDWLELIENAFRDKKVVAVTGAAYYNTP